MALNLTFPTLSITAICKKICSFLTVTLITWLLVIIVLLSTASSIYLYLRIQKIDAFNHAISNGKQPKTDAQSFEAKFSTAYWLANNERYKEATLLFNNLQNIATPMQKAAIQFNLGNIFFKRGLFINGTSMTVRDEAEYLFRQAKTAYQQSLRLDPDYWGARHNLDRILTMMPGTPTPGVGESDTPGLIMGNVPVGMP